ncbi:hypothetical protein A1O3_00032 [Capronia epimyces CBS 606.96]|uniref:BZIP domain-containing protein n=1 Tax=Capronia epimyces CBS 606.96 TaxID=1182542 RepID=W9ZAE1_9EURO|nr:uncharacterized protein A1O3_00032 [Capronia epimyces CBS 606.96]EXJ91484.1 hypothetical protein A1O3_00032 [Capronia epimyces CBS 606.96]
MSVAGNGAINKSKGQSKTKILAAKKKPASADQAQSHNLKAARKRTQNRISQKCLREKQLAQMQHLNSFLDMIQASRTGGDDNNTALMKAHLKLLEENQQMKAVLLRMRKKLLSLSNSTSNAADDDIFDHILGQAEANDVELDTSTQRKQINQTPKTKVSSQGLIVNEDYDEAAVDYGNSAWSGRAHSDSPAHRVSRGGGTSERSPNEAEILHNNEDSPPFPSFEDHRADFRANLRDELQWTPMMESVDFSNMPDMLNPVPEPTFDLALSLDSTEARFLHYTSQTMLGDTVNLSGKAMADLVERACIIYALQILNMPVDADGPEGPQVLAALKQQYAHRVPDQVVEDLARVATNILTVFAGIDAYAYGIGASEIMERILRWRLKPTTTNRLAIPEPLRPTPLQSADGVSHPLVIDLIAWPKLRDQLILLSRQSDVDYVIGDIVLHTVVEVPQIHMSLSVLDLFHNRVFPNMNWSADTSMQQKDGVPPTLMAGPDNKAIRSIRSEIGLRMAQMTADNATGREPAGSNANDNSYSAFNERPLSHPHPPRPKKHPLSAKDGIDKLSRWKISLEFADKYPSLDCSDRKCFLSL